MFESFLSRYKADGSSEEVITSPLNPRIQATYLKEFFKSFSGYSFNNGLYRVHSIERVDFWNDLVGEAFPEFASRIYCFGYDWLGRQFALDTGRLQSNEPLVVMLEPGTGEVLEIPTNILQFHEDEILNYANEVLALDFFNAWLALGHSSLAHNQCISYKKPLYLGGSDTLDNLESMELEVYWGLSSQLLAKVRGLPSGTSVSNISID